MFAKTIIDSDAFLDMPLSAQSLYFHLAMRADDDGFVNNPKKIQRLIGASDDDCKLLIAKRFILTFDSGIIVIKHWRVHNYIRNDRYKATLYQEEKSTLMLNENNAYTEMDTNGIPNGYQMDTQVRLGKVRLDKVSIDKTILDKFKSVLSVLKTKTNPTTYSAWFANLKLCEVNENTLTACDNKIVVNVINENYKDLLTETVKEVYGNEYEIVVKEQ